ncbi:MAG: archaemetzincin family Zn-dependent metalloprotease [Candidatus Lokiarchaeota archaeon]|nr:archaemetzincin family Zn-dependent metalloprotease [Candidatus Lokiarchaeota archaeon]MBD3340109.1 archaemetzincin family Zn-dependent metalloprotease [Candidatus Lokiarchaeota archaeon]
MSNNNKNVYLRKIGPINSTILKYLKKNIGEVFKGSNISFEMPEETLPLKDSDYNKERKQYDGSLILNRIARQSKKNLYFRTIGVMDVDLFSKGLNFIFGIATMPRSRHSKYYGSCIISVTRLREEYYGNAPNRKLFRTRTLKEAVHELGHTFGLQHCKNRCIMRFSNHLGETDLKPVEFCSSCKKDLNSFLENL